MAFGDVAIEADGVWLGYQFGAQDAAGRGARYSFSGDMPDTGLTVRLRASDGTESQEIRVGPPTATPSPYHRISSGTCTSHGLHVISDVAGCLAGAQALSLDIRASDPEVKPETGGNPAGCTYHAWGNLELYQRITAEDVACGTDPSRDCICTSVGSPSRQCENNMAWRSGRCRGFASYISRLSGSGLTAALGRYCVDGMDEFEHCQLTCDSCPHPQGGVYTPIVSIDVTDGVIVFGGSATYSGTVSGSPSIVEGPIAGTSDGILFGASGDMLNLGDSGVDTDGSWTIDCFFKTPVPQNGGWKTLTRGAGGDHQVIIHPSSYHLGSYDSVGGSLFTGTGFDVRSLADGWHRRTVAAGAGSVDFYVDG
eukprot:SAG22_NODE_4663_length_1200_cov_1.688465_1_plen_366_part_01